MSFHITFSKTFEVLYTSTVWSEGITKKYVTLFINGQLSNYENFLEEKYFLVTFKEFSFVF